MDSRYIITGHHAPEKRELARRLRREMTPAERRLWQAVRRSQLDGLHIRRQQIIQGFLADFYCHAGRLVIEVDGPIHAEQAEYDAERTEVFTRLGLLVLRFRNEEVFGNLEAVCATIIETARTRHREAAKPPATAPSPLPLSEPKRGR